MRDSTDNCPRLDRAMNREMNLFLESALFEPVFCVRVVVIRQLLTNQSINVYVNSRFKTRDKNEHTHE